MVKGWDKAAQSAKRFIVLKVTGYHFPQYEPIAQRSEQFTHNELVVGSNPTWLTKGMVKGWDKAAQPNSQFIGSRLPVTIPPILKTACHVSGTEGIRPDEELVLKTSTTVMVLGVRVPLLPQKGVVVQLVRIFACHANGRGFESRPHRNTNSPLAQLVRASHC